jgi:hypothetical protein
MDITEEKGRFDASANYVAISENICDKRYFLAFVAFRPGSSHQPPGLPPIPACPQAFAAAWVAHNAGSPNPDRQTSPHATISGFAFPARHAFARDGLSPEFVT